MKTYQYGIALVFVLGFTLNLEAQSYEEGIQMIRNQKDHELASKKHSPLQKVDRKAFDHLNYFEIDASWKKEAHFTRTIGGDTIDIMTSSGKVKQFETYGTFQFQVGDRTDTLTAYKRVWPEGFVSPYAPSLFMPFTDLCTGSDCYGGGRYLDMKIPEANGTVELDFNLCYNPYCAYGGGFSCPIPPKENFVNARIEAGEKSYSNH